MFCGEDTHYETVCPDNWSLSHLIDFLPHGTRTEAFKLLSARLYSNYHIVLEQIQALGSCSIVAIRPATMPLVIQPDSESKLRCGAKSRCAETSRAKGHSAAGKVAGSELLRLSSLQTSSRNRSRNRRFSLRSSCLTPTRILETRSAPGDACSSSKASIY